MTVDLVSFHKSRYRRTFVVRTDTGSYEIVYRGDGFGFEAVYVDGVEAARHGGDYKMTYVYEFEVGPHKARLFIGVPLWREVFIPLVKLTFVRLELDGALLHVEGTRPRALDSDRRGALSPASGSAAAGQLEIAAGAAGSGRGALEIVRDEAASANHEDDREPDRDG